MSNKIDVKKWLKAYGYDDVLVLIEEVEHKWRLEGKKTRRNWWSILAGGAKGKPKKVAGREFPVIRAIQQRQGLEATENAICRSKDETVPDVWEHKRWNNT